MKLLLLLAALPITVLGAECETVTYSTSPAPIVRKAVRPAAKRPVHKSRVVVRAPSKPKIRSVTRFDCPPPSSTPPGGVRIGGGVPFIGIPPVWGYPYPMPEPVGPQPIWPGSPNDFPPGTPPIPHDSGPPWIRPPGDTPPGMDQPPHDVPEPPTLAIILFGLSILVARRYMK